MRWGRTDTRHGRAAGVGARRLSAMAEQWRPRAGDDRATPLAPGRERPASPLQDRGWSDAESDDWTATGRGWTRSAVRGLALLVAVAVALAGYWAWSGRPRAVAIPPEVVATGDPVTGLPASGAPAAESLGAPMVPSAPVADPMAAAAIGAPAPIVVVHVTGMVAAPGLVELPIGSRVADAVAAAGGVTRPRAAESVNLARVLVDGEQIVVAATAVSAAPAAAPSAAQPALDLNTAAETALQDLPGIGPVIAARIVAWRVANGAFRSIDELGEVTGIGDAILAQIRPLARV